MSGYEEQELTAIDAALDANPDATSNEVFQATRPYDERAIASVAVSRALAGGGGSLSADDGSTTVANVTSLSLPTGSLSDLGGGEVGFFLGSLHFADPVTCDNSLNVLLELDNGEEFVVDAVGVGHLLTFEPGATNLGCLPGTATQLFGGLAGDPTPKSNIAVYDAGTDIQIPVGGAVTIYDASLNQLFRVDADGSVHIKTGTSIVADL